MGLKFHDETQQRGAARADGVEVPQVRHNVREHPRRVAVVVDVALQDVDVVGRDLLAVAGADVVLRAVTKSTVSSFEPDN